MNTEDRSKQINRHAIGDHCPRCDSPQPHLHPAVQAGGEVQPCPHAFHLLSPAGETYCGAHLLAHDEDAHQCRSCDQRNDTHSIGCPMHPDYDPDLTQTLSGPSTANLGT